MSETLHKGIPVWKKVLLSPTLATKNAAHRIAYIAIVTAFVVVANMFFEFKLMDTQFSLTILFSALAGILIGPLFGFVACFLGDLVGFLYNSAGFAYMPWIGLSMGVVAFISGLVIGGIRGKNNAFLCLKIAIVCVLTFAICTVGINTTAFWLLYSKVDYGTYLVSRLFVQGQIWNSVVNYALLFVTVFVLKGVKPLRVYIR